MEQMLRGRILPALYRWRDRARWLGIESGACEQAIEMAAAVVRVPGDGGG